MPQWAGGPFTPLFFSMAEPPSPGPPDRASADGSLLRRLRSDDEAALDEIVRAYWTPLVRYARGLLDAADAAEDVAQETFVRLWHGRERWDPHGGLNALVYRIARNLAIDEQRRRKVRLDWRSARQEAPARQEVDPGELAEAAELRDAVHRAIHALPERRGEVFMLARFHGMSYREIADLLGLAEQTVANHMSAALADIRRALGPYLTPDPSVDD